MKSHLERSRGWGWLSGMLLASAVLAQGVGMEELHRLDRLPVFKSSIAIGSVSSYDRSGGNDDGFSGRYSFVRKEGEYLVLADLKGPGVIYRVWTPTPTEDTLEFLFDGEAQPRLELKFVDLFLGRHPLFPSPLAGFGAGGYYCYVPLSYEKSCVVRIRAPKVQFYQINYARYEAGTPIRTFRPDLPPAELEQRAKALELFRGAGTDVSRFVTPPKAGVEVAASAVTLVAGAAQKVFEAGKGGRIVGLRVWPASAVGGKGRDLLLRISFDGEPPAVLCPLGDFFGYAWGRPAMQSLLVGTVGETNYCHFPMPFRRSAVVELVSERSRPAQLQVEVLHCRVAQGDDEGKFHALWRRENPTRIGEPYTFVKTEGRGHLVGVVLQAQGFESGKTLFFEGDDQTTVDGELVIHGTGSEDFFNGGWYDVPDRWEKRISLPLSGCLGYAKHLGRTGAYRLFLGDAPSFRRSLRQTIEHGGEKNSIPTDYCSVSYWYADRAPAGGITLPPLEQRAVVDLKELVFPAGWQLPIYAWSFDRATLTRKRERIENEEVRYLSLAATGADWFGPHFLSPLCDVPAGGRYAVYLETVKGPAQGIVQLFQNENPAGERVDLYAGQQARSGRVRLGRLELAEGPNNLMFKLVGKNEKSAGLGLDLVNVVLVKEE